MKREVLSFPGFADVHVHFRDPGVPEAETTASGLAAARRGGFAAVVTMPNTTPPIDTPESVRSHTQQPSNPTTQQPNNPTTQQPNNPTTQQPNNVPLLFTSACITRGRQGREVADLERLAEAGAAFFTDDGSYVAETKVMEEAMRRAAKLGMVVSQHAMDPALQNGGVIRDCALARRLGLPVIVPETETAAIRRDLSLCRVTGCRLHVQHISTAAGVELVRAAQREGLPVTAEATPHHLLLTCDDLVADDANFKMAPPLGNREDRAELRRAVKEGVLMFATDHAPHPPAAKAKGFRASANGIVGLEAALAVTYTVMVAEEGMDVAAWARAWSELPRALLANPVLRPALDGWPETRIEVGGRWSLDLSDWATKSRNCPYDGYESVAGSAPVLVKGHLPDLCRECDDRPCRRTILRSSPPAALTSIG